MICMITGSLASVPAKSPAEPGEPDHFLGKIDFGGKSGEAGEPGEPYCFRGKWILGVN